MGARVSFMTMLGLIQGQNLNGIVIAAWNPDHVMFS